MALKLIWNNIINEPTDVIVTAASRIPRVGTGVDEVIHAAGGDKLKAARMKLGNIEPGVVKVTPSFGLAKSKCRAKYVIHALGPFCQDKGLDGTERPLLLGCYLQIICTAVSLKAKTVSMPVFSSGKFGMEMPLAVDTAVEAIQLFLKVVPKLQVKLVGIDREFFEYASKKYPKLTVAHFDAASEKAYRDAGHVRFRDEDGINPRDKFPMEEESDYFKTIRFRRETKDKAFHRLFHDQWLAAKERDAERWETDKKGRRGKRDVGEYLLHQKDLEQRSGVSGRKIKRYLSQTGKDKCLPPRDTIIRLAWAMEVEMPFLKAMLMSCNYAVERGELSRRDNLILELYQQKLSLAQIDAKLQVCGEKPL